MGISLKGLGTFIVHLAEQNALRIDEAFHEDWNALVDYVKGEVNDESDPNSGNSGVTVNPETPSANTVPPVPGTSDPAGAPVESGGDTFQA
jgi:hypothetical protein